MDETDRSRVPMNSDRPLMEVPNADDREGVRVRREDDGDR
jgi:hypothetical protein